MLSVQIGQYILFHISASYWEKTEQSKNVKGFSSSSHASISI